MGILNNGFKFGSIKIDPRFAMSRNDMQQLNENAEEYPDLFPIWCTDDNALYIFYKDDNGVPRISNFNNLVTTTEKVVFYPIIDVETNEISWEPRTLTDEIPQPVVLSGRPGPSAYEVWLEEGHEGSKQDFFNSFIPDLNALSPEQITRFKEQLGIDTIMNTLDAVGAALSEIVGEVPEESNNSNSGENSGEPTGDNPSTEEPTTGE